MLANGDRKRTQHLKQRRKSGANAATLRRRQAVLSPHLSNKMPTRLILGTRAACQHNPRCSALFFDGGRAGQNHLLHARKSTPKWFKACIRARFRTEALQTTRSRDLNTAHRPVDALLIDDCSVFKHKESRKSFHNALFRSNRLQLDAIRRQRRLKAFASSTVAELPETRGDPMKRPTKTASRQRLRSNAERQTALLLTPILSPSDLLTIDFVCERCATLVFGQILIDN